MPTAAPAAPAAPVTAPAAAASPAPKTAPMPAPATAKNDDAPINMAADLESELEQLAQDPPRQENKRAPAKKNGKAPVTAPEKKEPENKTPGAPEEDPAGELEEKAATETPAPEPTKVPELRQAYRDAKKEIETTYKPTIQRLEAEIKELKAGKPEDSKPLLDRAEKAEKRVQELESEMQFVDYTRSKEFTDKYVTPYKEAWQRAEADFAQLRVRIPDGLDENDQPKFKLRQATTDDLLHLANLPLSEMDEKAAEMFGTSASRVIHHVERVRDLFYAQNKAITDAQKTNSELAQRRQAESRAVQEKRSAAWNQQNTALAEKYPKWFKEIEGDQPGNDLFKKGLAMADKLFAPSAENPAPQSEQDAMRLHSLIRFKAANHDRLALQVRNLKAKLAEAEQSLADYQASEPGPGRGGEPGAGGAISQIDDANAELDKLAR